MLEYINNTKLLLGTCPLNSPSLVLSLISIICVRVFQMKNRITQKMWIGAEWELINWKAWRGTWKCVGFALRSLTINVSSATYYLYVKLWIGLLNLCDPQFIHLQNVVKQFTHHKSVVPMNIYTNIRNNFKIKYICVMVPVFHLILE